MAYGQRIPGGEYTRYLPIERPPLVRQTTGSEELLLYGDRNSPDYQDVSPVDGIDDRRAENLTDQLLNYLLANFFKMLFIN
jgi:hypothetical protein